MIRKENQLQQKEDYQRLVKDLVDPLMPYFAYDNTRLHIGEVTTIYDRKTRGIEAFARPLWGLAPFWAGGGNHEIEANYREGFKHGGNPAHENYWGVYGNAHQVYVEMAAMALSILLVPEKVWEPLSEKEKEGLADWLLQMNDRQIVENNWQFFRVLVNIALRKVGAEYSQEAIDYSLGIVEACYLGDGWYSDGLTPQKDYYIAFAIHFYSLIYAKFMEAEDAERSKQFKERARLFAKEFIYWFTEEGDSLPFGRSLTYRFAQCSFFSALAFADVEAFEWGIVKGIVNRHMRWWMNQPIFDKEGLLTVGYGYPNGNMAEGYNGDGSPYWAFKALLVLALDEKHGFWMAEEMPLPKLEEVKCLKHPQMLIQRPEEGHVISLTSGQYANFEPVHVAEKYAKFAYSSYFGFNVPRSYYRLEQLAPDNMLAFKKDGLYFVRRRCAEVQISEACIYSRWIPLEGVEVETTITPQGTGHIRKHRIQAAFDIEAVEGGFAVPSDDWPIVHQHEGVGFVTIDSPSGYSHIELRKGEGQGQCILCEPNTNLVHPRAILPVMTLKLAKGITEIEVYVEGLRESRK